MNSFDEIHFALKLEWKRLNRRLKDWGLAKELIILTLFIALILLTILAKKSFILFSILSYLLIQSAMGVKENQFYKSILQEKNYLFFKRCKMVLYALPFLGILMYYGQWLHVLGVLTLVTLIPERLNTFSITNGSIPSPFPTFSYKHNISFRKYFFLQLALLFLIIPAYKYHNFRLALFSVISIQIVIQLGAFLIEPRTYIQIHSRNSNQFLWQQVKNLWIHFIRWPGPIIALLLLLFPHEWIWFVVVIILVMLHGTYWIFLMYSKWPKEIQIPDVLLILISIWFPPLLILMMPFAFKKASENLKTVLL